MVNGCLHGTPPATITVDPWDILEQRHRAVGMLGYGVVHLLFFSSHRNTLLVISFTPLLLVTSPPIANSCFLSGTVTRLKLA